MSDFWRKKSLSQMNQAEWESLCDGCAKCCLKKLEDIDTGKIFYTSIACNLLNLSTCQCTDYQNRNTRIPECIGLTPENTNNLSWLPKTCAYKLLANGEDLPNWHPLISLDKNTVFEAGIAIRSFAILENDINGINIENFIIKSKSL